RRSSDLGGGHQGRHDGFHYVTRPGRRLRRRFLGAVQQRLPVAADRGTRRGAARAGRGGALRVRRHGPADLPVRTAGRPGLPERAGDDGRGREVLLRPGPEDEARRGSGPAAGPPRLGAGGGTVVTFELTSPDATFPFKVATGAGSIVDSRTYP